MAHSWGGALAPRRIGDGTRHGLAKRAFENSTLRLLLRPRRLPLCGFQPPRRFHADSAALFAALNLGRLRAELETMKRRLDLAVAESGAGGPPEMVVKARDQIDEIGRAHV